jgi:hypothetical protein
VDEPPRKARRHRSVGLGVAAVVLLVASATAAGVLTVGRGGTAPAPMRRVTPHGGQNGTVGLPKSNLRVLTEAQTRHLLAYAAAVRTCLRRHGIVAEGPTKTERTITLETETPVGTGRLVRVVLPCAARIGDPPPPASLQVIDERTVALSVPKQCLLDPKLEA